MDQAQQVFTFHIDFGQIVITTIIGVIGYLMIQLINSFKERLDEHDTRIIQLVGDVQRLIGITSSWDGRNRRTE